MSVRVNNAIDHVHEVILEANDESYVEVTYAGRRFCTWIPTRSLIQ